MRKQKITLMALMFIIGFVAAWSISAAVKAGEYSTQAASSATTTTRTIPYPHYDIPVINTTENRVSDTGQTHFHENPGEIRVTLDSYDVPDFIDTIEVENGYDVNSLDDWASHWLSELMSDLRNGKYVESGSYELVSDGERIGYVQLNCSVRKQRMNTIVKHGIQFDVIVWTDETHETAERRYWSRSRRYYIDENGEIIGSADPKPTPTPQPPAPQQHPESDKPEP